MVLSWFWITSWNSWSYPFKYEIWDWYLLMIVSAFWYFCCCSSSLDLNEFSACKDYPVMISWDWVLRCCCWTVAGLPADLERQALAFDRNELDYLVMSLWGYWLICCDLLCRSFCAPIPFMSVIDSLQDWLNCCWLFEILMYSLSLSYNWLCVPYFSSSASPSFDSIRWS